MRCLQAHLHATHVHPSYAPALCLQAHLNGGIAAWYTSRFDGADHPNKNKVIKARVEYVNVLASKVAVQIMGSAVLLGSLGAALALATLRHNWDHLSAQVRAGAMEC